MTDREETSPDPPAFDFSAFPDDTLFLDRRTLPDRRELEALAAPPPAADPTPPPQRRAKKERRRRIDPTTFEKQYTDDEVEFMTAIQRFKVQSGKSFPSHGDILRVALALGYRQVLDAEFPEDDEFSPAEPAASGELAEA